MKKYHLYCSLEGEQLEPYELEENISIVFESKAKKGELSRIRKTPFASGNAGYYIPVNNENLRDAFKAFFEIIDEILLKDTNDDIALIDLCLSVYYTAQCSLGFDAETLAELGKRNISFAIDCYKVEEEDLQTT